MLGQRVVLALRGEEVVLPSQLMVRLVRLSVSVNASKHRLHTGLHTGRFSVHFRAARERADRVDQTGLIRVLHPALGGR